MVGWSDGAGLTSGIWAFLLIWIEIGQGPTAFAVGAGGVSLDIFLSSIFLSSFSLSLGDGPI